MYLYCLTQENYPGLPKKPKDNWLPWAKSKNRQVRGQITAARLALCARPYFSVFFPPAFVKSQMAQVDRLGILERWVLGSSALCRRSFFAVFTFFPFRWGLRKIRSLSAEWRKESLTQIKLSLKESLIQIKLFLKERIMPVKLSLAKVPVCGWMGTQG